MCSIANSAYPILSSGAASRAAVLQRCPTPSGPISVFLGTIGPAWGRWMALHTLWCASWVFHPDCPFTSFKVPASMLGVSACHGRACLTVAVSPFVLYLLLFISIFWWHFALKRFIRCVAFDWLYIVLSLFSSTHQLIALPSHLKKSTWNTNLLLLHLLWAYYSSF